MRRRVLAIGSLGAAACAAVAAFFVVPAWQGNTTPAPPNAPIAATLRLLAPPVIPGEPVELLATAISATPISQLQLFGGGKVIAEVPIVGSRLRAVERMRWNAPAAGTQLLILRAVDERGRVAHAAPLRVRVPEAVGGQGGGSAVATAAAGPRLTVEMDGCTAHVSAEGGGAGTSLALYGLGPGQAGFQPLRFGDRGGSEATVPLVSGEVAFYALEYGSGDASASPVDFVRAPTECAAGRWQGDVSIVDGLLNVPGVAPDLAYLYLSVDGGGWQRVPAKDQSFVRKRYGQLDFGRVLPPLGKAKRIDVEAWTRRDGAAVRLGAGSLEAEPEITLSTLLGLLPATELDLLFKLPLVDSQEYKETLVREGEIHAYTETSAPPPSGSPNIAPKPQFNFTFRWQPKAPAITHGIWQVTMVPPGTAPTVGAPGLLAYGTVPATQSDFHIDFKPLVLPQEKPPATTQAVSFTDLVPQAYTEAKSAGGTGDPPQDAVEKAGVGNLIALSPPQIPPYELVRIFKPPRLYVRIVPMNGEQPVAAVSNSVTFTLHLTDPTPPKLKQPPAFGVKVQLDRPYLPNHKYAYCVRVIENPFGSDNPAPVSAIQQFYKPAPVGGTLCPDKPSDDDDFDLIEFFEGAVDLAVDFWDTLVTAFDYLKAQAAKLLVTVSGCGKGPTSFLSEEDCNSIASIAIDVTLMAFGIPPDLPTSQELFALAKGELVDGLYALAAANGISCDLAEEQCKQMMHKLLDEVVKQAEQEVSKAALANASTGGVLFLNPQIKVVPEPRGRLQPAVFRVTYTRLSASDAALPEKCTTTAQIYGRRENWQWYDYDEKKHQTGTVEGYIFLGGNTTPLNLRDLAQGESVTRLVSISTPAKWYEPGADPYAGENDGQPGYVQVHSDPSHYWVLMRGGSKLTAWVGACGGYTVVDTWTTSDVGWQE